MWHEFTCISAQPRDLIIRIIEEVEQAFEEGYLYIENYDGQGDDYFESEEVNDYIFCFVSNLTKELKSNYTKKLRKVLANSGYSTFLSIERKLA